tara:strand:- start:1325 stop:1732 length:408 start_codon:yes stop_codon:yes gene_type:complete
LSKNISDKDKKDWLKFIESKDKIPDKDIKNASSKNLKQKKIDLHGYSLDEANNLIKEFIQRSYEERINKIIVVTGKGLHSQNEKDPYVSKDFGILKYSVPEFIKSDKNLMNIINEIKGAEIEDGGSGAFYIFLKK